MQTSLYVQKYKGRMKNTEQEMRLLLQAGECHFRGGLVKDWAGQSYLTLLLQESVISDNTLLPRSHCIQRSCSSVDLTIPTEWYDEGSNKFSFTDPYR